MSKHCDLLLDYFNNQLTEKETKEFELHLSTCSACTEELNELQELTKDLPYSSEEAEPSEGMKDRILGNIINDIHEKEVNEKQTEPIDKAQSKDWHIPKTKKKNYFYQPLIAAVLTLSLIGNAVALIYFTGDQEEAEPAPLESDQSLDTMQEMFSLSPSEGIKAQATAMMIEQNNDTNLVIQAEDLPVLKDDETYQVWVLQDGEPSRAGTFVLNENGVGAVSYVLKDDKDHNWDTIAITKEPDANSQQPQGDILLSSPL